jgi:hypothetical protein
MSAVQAILEARGLFGSVGAKGFVFTTTGHSPVGQEAGQQNSAVAFSRPAADDGHGHGEAENTAAGDRENSGP